MGPGDVHREGPAEAADAVDQLTELQWGPVMFTGKDSDVQRRSARALRQLQWGPVMFTGKDSQEDGDE